MQRRGVSREQRWVEKPNANRASSSSTATDGDSVEAITKDIGKMRIAQNRGEPSGSVPVLQFENVRGPSHVLVQGQKAFWKPKSYGTVSGSSTVEVEKVSGNQMAGEVQGNAARTTPSEVNNALLSKLPSGNLLERFVVDNDTYSQAQIRATFYPKFENEKSDHEVILFLVFSP